MVDARIEQAFAAGRVPSNITREYLSRNRDAEGLSAIIVITLLVSAVVVSRLLARALVVKRLGLDDGLALASLLFFVPFAITCTQMILYGSGRPFIFRKLILPDEQFDITQSLDTISQLLYATAMVLVRASGLAFYHRICALYNEFLIIIKFIFCIIFLGYLAQMTLIILHCLPLTTLWEPSPGGKYKCMQWIDVQGINSVVSLLSDLLVFGVPLAMLRVLKSMDRKRKIQLSCIFFPGLVNQSPEDDDDFTYSFLILLVIEVSEIGVSLIAISLPGLKPLIEKFIFSKFSSSDDSRASRRSSLTANSWRAARPPSLSVEDSKPALGPSAGFEVRTVTSVQSPKKKEGGDEEQGKGISVTSEFCVEAQDANNLKVEWGKGKEKEMDKC
ncbi:hypothetical protein CDD80_5428 [Ophiocordyceps camponoti-rufipedis]|uniref:Rhodopsin domain-containing protein n=1 Tax=Ophiocordyceps camponoti-rufipedis TaxID=2004952 RepID=A0A2C5XZB9_9HYPO|nr:hypothetical protein CDD80_5428 [Ophiocordyceps camponoti-rufipedis]